MDTPVLEFCLKRYYLVIVEKEGEEVGEPQHGLSVHAIVQVILQELFPQDHMVSNDVFLLYHTYKEKSAGHLALLCSTVPELWGCKAVACPCTRYQGTEALGNKVSGDFPEYLVSITKVVGRF